MSAAAVQEYILSQCKKLVPTFDAKETIHAFCGARAKSDRGDWIIERSSKHPNFINVAGIDSPGLAGAPSIALKVVDLLKEAGLKLSPNPKYNPYRAPIITPKDGMKGLKMGPVGKFDSDGHDMKQMAANVICKCEKVTELEVVRAMRRSLPIDSSQAIRKRTRAGMGHCQGTNIFLSFYFQHSLILIIPFVVLTRSTRTLIKQVIPSITTAKLEFVPLLHVRIIRPLNKSVVDHGPQHQVCQNVGLMTMKDRH
jgi:BFD-like [2Fe-2S] binding domain